MTEQRRSKPIDQGLDLIRRIQRLADRAERTAFDHSNLVGPPPSQEHLDILAEIRALSRQAVADRAKADPLPRQADPAPGENRPTGKPLATGAR
ncbi:hypothetical protein GCM10022243_12890 [Saccharothrix violaceirubra]|uniref:Putative transcriptional regulator n=1 Tax=Saccharothrix violaceirubra TaxID=413306 RepID=A0A7W7T6M4_9PSEU|nr:hypothetical protein [Saccharothrix violaceirubra]MBB4967528.1 putative transcriptional regulator [Saccharothrix violaceirubra]